MLRARSSCAIHLLCWRCPATVITAAWRGCRSHRRIRSPTKTGPRHRYAHNILTHPPPGAPPLLRASRRRPPAVSRWLRWLQVRVSGTPCASSWRAPRSGRAAAPQKPAARGAARAGAQGCGAPLRTVSAHNLFDTSETKWPCVGHISTLHSHRRGWIACGTTTSRYFNVHLCKGWGTCWS